MNKEDLFDLIRERLGKLYEVEGIKTTFSHEDDLMIEVVTDDGDKLYITVE